MVQKEAIKKATICLHCSKPINLKNYQYVVVSTLNRLTEPDDHTFFHFPCWADYFNQRVEIKMRQNLQAMQEQAMNLFNSPMMKGLLSQISGSNIALNMLRTPLQSQTELVKADPVLKIQIKKKLKHGKKRGRKKKAQVHKV